MKWTLYQKYRRYRNGMRKYFATKNDQIRHVYAESAEHAQTKYLTWTIYKAGFCGRIPKKHMA